MADFAPMSPGARGDVVKWLRKLVDRVEEGHTAWVYTKTILDDGYTMEFQSGPNPRGKKKSLAD